MTEERLKLHEEAEKRINAIIDTLSQDKGGLAEKLKQEDVMDFLVSFWVDCSAEKNKLIEELQDKLGTVQMQKAGEKSDLVSHLVEANENYKKQIEELKKDKEVQTHNLNVLNDEIIRLQAQVEKMKCCSNCKFLISCCTAPRVKR